MMKLREGVVLMRIDQEGILVDTNTGRYMAVNVSGCEMIEALANLPSEEAVLGKLSELIHADAETLKEGISSLKQQLAELELIAA